MTAVSTAKVKLAFPIEASLHKSVVQQYKWAVIVPVISRSLQVPKAA